MTLSVADVEHVAALARLGLNEGEKARLREQLSSILEHIAALDEVETGTVSPTASVAGLTNVTRADEVRPSLPRDVVLMSAPRQADGFFEVHAILAGADEETTG